VGDRESEMEREGLGPSVERSTSPRQQLQERRASEQVYRRFDQRLNASSFARLTTCLFVLHLFVNSALITSLRRMSSNSTDREGSTRGSTGALLCCFPSFVGHAMRLVSTHSIVMFYL